jgi:hypothetical protein
VVSPTSVGSGTFTVPGSPPITQPPSSLVDVDAVAVPQWSGTGCPQSGLALQQSVTGQFSQCLQVGGVPGGDYAIVLEQVLSPPTDVAPASPAVPGLQLTASPASGPPGTTVTVTGTVPAALSPQPGEVSLCWDGCPGGLSYPGEALRWLSPTTFQTTIVVPHAPWVTAWPPRVVPLTSGTYSIGVQCLQEAHACGLGGAEATTSFQLDVPAAVAPSWCRTADSCAQMTVSPAHALPGEHITVTGFAPVASIGGDGQPFAYQLQVIPAPTPGPVVQFQSLGKSEATAAYFGYGALTVTASPSFASINSAGWRVQEADGWQPITADPATPSTTAWCTGGAIIIDTAGRTTTVPTGPAAQAVLTAMGFPPSPGDTGPLSCDTLALLGNGTAGAPAVVAGFGVEPADQEPLYADVALLTRDGGKSWTPLPTPRGINPDSFGGFRYQGSTVTAVFTPSGNGPQGRYPAPPVETSSDAGRSWHATTLGCPTSGPCITFGSLQPGNCAKNGAYEPVIASTDGGHHWALTSLDENVDACWQAQLLREADGSEVLVDSSSTFTVQRSTDDGRTWADIDVPPAPDQQVGDGYNGAIIALPGGSLLALGQDITHPWMLLRPDTTTWCDVQTTSTINQNFLFYGDPRAIGDQLWWLTSANDNTGATAHHIALAELTC